MTLSLPRSLCREGDNVGERGSWVGETTMVVGGEVALIRCHHVWCSNGALKKIERGKIKEQSMPCIIHDVTITHVAAEP